LLHVAQISFFTDPQGRTPEQLLNAWPTLVDVAEAASRCAVRVSVIQACPQRQCLTRNGVSYRFLPLGGGSAAHASPESLERLLRRLAPQILHVHGLDFVRDVTSLAAVAPGVPIVLQDHASRPPRIWRRSLWRRGFGVASGITFCALDQARPFANAGLIPPQTRVYEIPESTSRFAPGDQDQARRATGLTGDPLVLWVGHLDANKDPLTILDGIGAAARKLPGLQLACCFGTAPLLRAVRRRIASDPLLSGRVQLLGRVPHERVEQLMRAADLFVLGSQREGSGYSLIEAMACGLPPVVTDIPSFRSLTGSGRIGALWPQREPAKLCAALLSMATRPRAPLRAAVRTHFDRELSFDALGQKWASAYQDLIGRGTAGPLQRNRRTHVVGQAS
jgi:glycosyltransferase involved in cell wall biosynthesis